MSYSIKPTQQKMTIIFLLSLCFGRICLSEGRDLVNVAVGKKAYQSSTWYGFVAGKAVDGGTSQQYSQGSCSITEQESNAFWEVDFGNMYYIDHVIIYNRGDCCAERLRNVQLLIGKKDKDYTLHGYHEGIVAAPYTFQLQHVVAGKWVRITRNSSVTEHLTLCEVQVFGRPYEMHFSKDRGQKGTGEIIQTLKTRTLEECGFRCLKTDGCEATNFLGVDFECELLSSKTTEPAATDVTVLIRKTF